MTCISGNGASRMSSISAKTFCAIAAMAKVSQAGTVKTRLVPPLALEQAATLNTCFIRDLAANIQAASASADVAGYIAYTPRGAEPFFRDILPDCFGLLEPREAGLGPSLFCAAEDLLTVGH